MDLLRIIFWSCLGIVIYSYVGYGVLLYLIVSCKRIFASKIPVTLPGFEPDVAMVIPAYNEENFIEKKIANTLELNYPPDKLRIICITDGSSDRTPQIINKYPHITLMHLFERRGKTAAMNRAMRVVNEPIVIFSDANTLINKEGVREIVKHYADVKTGGVAGEKRVSSSADLDATSGEGLYWKYESILKKLDSELYSVVGAAGELFSIRRELYEDLDDETLIEDFVLSLRVCLKGYRVRYEPGAFAVETGSESMKDEQIRKVRISAGAFQALGMVRELFNVFKYPVLSFQFISHRVLRWTLCPLSLILAFFTNLGIILVNNHPFYIATFVLQAIFYLLATFGWIFATNNIRIKALYIPYYVLFMNISVLMGFSRYIKNEQSVLWEKAKRRNDI